MGFIQAVKGSIGGSLTDQWKDFYGPKSNVSATAGVFPGVPMGTNNGRGANYKGNENIITNGSKIVVPEGTALVTIQDGAITGIITEAGKRRSDVFRTFFKLSFGCRYQEKKQE